MTGFVEDLGRFQTANEKLFSIVAEARRIAVTINPVLILGDQGSGRRELALEVFENSPRKNSRLVRWTNSEFSPEKLLSSDSVLIENLENFTKAQQHSLFESIAATLTHNPHKGPRWIATACRDLSQKVKSGNFLLGLYQVLSTHVLIMPSLNERLEDILDLAQAAVENWNMITSQRKILSAEVCSKLVNYTYNENVSELLELIEKAYSRCAGTVMNLSHFGWSESPQISQAGLTLSEMERRLILQTLEMTNQNRTKAAEILGISIRTLRNKLNEYRNMGDKHEQSLR